MARPFKIGLEYYPVDVDLDEDDKLIDIFIELGTDRGLGIVLLLLNSIYKNGYYLKWNDSVLRKLCLKKRLEQPTVKQAIEILTGSDRSWEELKESPSFFDKNMFKNEKILTSTGIQKRFFSAIERRKIIEVDKRYILINYEFGSVKVGSKSNDRGGYDPVMEKSNYFQIDKKTIPFQFVIHGLIEDRETQEKQIINADTNRVNVNTNPINADINKTNDKVKVNVSNNSVNVNDNTQSIVDREYIDIEIERESTIIKTPKAELAAQSKNPLYNSIKESFLSQNGGQFTDYAKEGKSIKGLIKKAETRFPEDPGSFIKSAIEIFYDLTQSNDKYWNSQPFIPSRLNSSGIFDSVLKQMQEDVFIPNEPDYDNMEAGEIIF